MIPREEYPSSVRVHEFISLYDKPIVSTSANISGYVSPTSFSMISEDILDGADAYLDLEIADTDGKPSQIVRMEPN